MVFDLDLHQRLAGLRIETPSLRAQLDAEPGDLERLVRFFAERLADDEEEAELTELTLGHIEEHLPRYGWPGNVRELGHCVEAHHHGGHFMLLSADALPPSSSSGMKWPPWWRVSTQCPSSRTLPGHP